jgi:SAM-dependent methyltransferase
MNSPQMPPVDLSAWSDVLVCPVDRTALTLNAQGDWQCQSCSFCAARVENGGHAVHDFRARHIPQSVALTFRLPVMPLDRYEVARQYFRGPGQLTEEAPVKVTTKLDRGGQYYLRQVLRQYGPDAPILDLGCGNGDNRRFMQAIGFRRVLTVDWQARGADLLVDAHRLPLASRSFQVVVSTAVFEHLYNPFVAMSEVSRVLTDTGCFIGSASFWEAWHGSSYFHLTPDGWNALLEQNDLHLEDLWTGWGIIPSALSHVLTPGHLRRPGYLLQRFVERVYHLWGGEMAVRKFQLRASGSYVVYAVRRRQAH